MQSPPADATAAQAPVPPTPRAGEPMTSGALRICMLLHKGVAYDTRVLREAGALVDAGHRVTVVHLPTPESGEADESPFALVPATLRSGRRRLPRPLRLGTEAWRMALRAGSSQPDVVHAHDAAMLLPGLLAARRRRACLVYDSHELATGVPYRSRSWALLVKAAERLAVPRADATIAVSEGIAARLREDYGLSRSPTVVRNLPDLPLPGATRTVDLRRELGIGDAPLVLHQGAVSSGRGCETLVRALQPLAAAHLLFLGAEGEYVGRLRRLAGESELAGRVHFRAPAPPRELLSLTAQADVGVSLLEDNCENHRVALPNKLFEYIAAGLPVVVSDLPEAGRLVRERGIGWCADAADPAGVAAALSTALAHQDDEGLRDRLRAAGAELTWAREKQRLLELYERLAAEVTATAPASR